MLVDSGSSFTFLPDQIYGKVVDEVTLFLDLFNSLSIPLSVVKVSEFVLVYWFGYSLTGK